MQPAEFRPAQNYDTNPYYDNAEWPGPGYVTIEPLSVTENDTYTAEEGKAYSPVTVNVAGVLNVGNVYEPIRTVTIPTEWLYVDNETNYTPVCDVFIGEQFISSCIMLHSCEGLSLITGLSNTVTPSIYIIEATGYDVSTASVSSSTVTSYSGSYTIDEDGALNITPANIPNPYVAHDNEGDFNIYPQLVIVDAE